MQKREQPNKAGVIKQQREKASCDFVPVEMSLERIAFFTPSWNGRNGLGEKRIDQDELKVVLRVNQAIGLPITTDQDLYRAFQKIIKEHVDEGRALSEPIVVPTNRLLRYADKLKNKRIVSEVKRWLDRMAYVGIKATFYPGNDKPPITIRGTVFDTVLSPGEAFEETGEIAETNYVWLSRWYLQSIATGYLRTIDLDFHNSLRRPIAKAVYPLLQTGWFATTRKGKVYQKRYSHLCEMFLLERYSSLSRIAQQLDPSFKELQKHGFLASWEYQRSKTDSSDWIIAWRPGEKYRDDRQYLKERKEIALRIKEGLGQSSLEAIEGPQLMLLEDILDVCQDKKSEAGYRRVIQTYPESTIRAALSETKLAAHQGRIRKTRGAYFMDTIKRLAAMRQEGGKA